MWMAIIQHCRMKVLKCTNDSTAEGLDPPRKWAWDPKQSLSGLQAFENLPEDLNTLKQNYLSSDFNLKFSLEAISSTLHISYAEHLGAFMPT